MTKPRVGVVMGSASDWEVMRHAVAQLENLDISYQAKLVSAHRTPDLLFEDAEQAELREFARAIQTRSEDGSAHASAGRHAGHPGGRTARPNVRRGRTQDGVQGNRARSGAEQSGDADGE